jgi:hypothetical protein
MQYLLVTYLSSVSLTLLIFQTAKRSKMIVHIKYFKRVWHVLLDRFCGLAVRVPGYRYRGLGFDSRRYQIFWEIVGLERGPLSLVRIIE